MSTVLIVDDDSFTRDLFGRILAKHVDTVLQAENGRVALNILTSHPEIDLIVLDLVMPFMSGSELLDVIKNTPSLAAIPVIVVTGNAARAQQIASQSAVDYLVKPIDMLAFVEKINRHIVAKT